MGAASTPPPGASTSSPAPAAAEDPHHHHIEVDRDLYPENGPDDDDDDGYSSAGVSDASTSLASSILDFKWENNRRYHKFREGEYHFPNDEPEQERENIKHLMVLQLLGNKLFLAPVDLEDGNRTKKVLDVGTGTGAWAIDIGDEFPKADIIGIDLSPIQPSWLPPNVRFRVDSAEDDWLDYESFDFIHLRHMNAAIKDWPQFFDRAYRHTKPGGWIELQEYDFTLTSDDNSLAGDWPYYKCSKLIHQGLEALGVVPHSTLRNPQYLRDAGFTNITTKVFKVPLGVWPKDRTLKTIGMYQRHAMVDGLNAITMGPFTRGLKWKPEEVEVFLVEVRRTIEDPKVHSYFPFHVVYAQRPEETGEGS
ncbi:S-adenosyl-L-methionine-dependent methyltransferase [Zalerion maritima]|uniref:S-adenosyl-L-methionine-dependent methyltransferase n=1 Tax=Zalerion maritima TaxID=339359 RepID=A0AAD5WNE6_9PEZI|nr:S-adenosyl-L-methionine-dependent methyltransferase [Zalerion maritima]